jgi:hypothetical chaperone protein
MRLVHVRNRDASVDRWIDHAIWAFRFADQRGLLMAVAGAEARLGVGLDFGTSNSTAAWFDGKTLHYVALEGSSPVMPTAIHLDRNYVSMTGSDAIDQYVEENRGRLVELVPEVIGEMSTSIGGGDLGDSNPQLDTERNLVYGPLVDRTLPGRLFHGLKRLLGDRSLDRLSVFSKPFRLVALITPVLVRMREAIEGQTRRRVATVHAGRPVNFEGRQAARNSVATERLLEAYRHAGFHDVHFYPEPVAATLSYLWRARPSERGIALTIDFGGGTLDLSVVRFAGSTFEVLGTDGIGLGGNRIDQLIFRSVLFPLLGEGEWYARRVEGRLIETPFPFHEFETNLLNWPITHMLNENRTRTMVVEALAAGGPAAIKFERLKDLISYNYSYNCFQSIKRAKAELSEATETFIDIPELNLRVPFTRDQLDDILAEELENLRRLTDDLLTRVRLQRADVSIVIRTGGSSLIVAVKQLLESMFPTKVAMHDPFTSVAGGLAIADYYGYVFDWSRGAKQDARLE